MNESPDGDGYSFTLIPAQDIDYKVELELRIRYGSPPPVVTFDIQLNYQFTGASDIYSIRSWANRDSNEPSLEVLDVDFKGEPGQWQTFNSGHILVQMSCDSGFTIELWGELNGPG